MADNTETGVKFTADSSGVIQGMKDASSAVQSSVTEMRGHLDKLGDSFGVLTKGLAGFSALLAGGALFAGGINATKELTGEAMKLSKSLGITSEEGSILNVALKSIGSSSDAYTSANSKLTRQLKTNEAGLQAMGVQTRNANGDLKNGQEVMTSAVEALKGYKEGTDRNIAAQTMFGRGGAEVMALMKLTSKTMDEAKEKAEALGLVIGSQQASEVKAYKEAMEGVGLVLDGIKNAIGQALIPVLTELAEWFNSTGPARVQVMRIVMNALADVFRIVIDTVVTLKDIIGNCFARIGEAIGLGGKEGITWMQVLTNVLSMAKVAVLGLELGFTIAFEFIGQLLEVAMATLRMYADVAIAALHLDWEGVKDGYKTGTAAIEKIVDDSNDRILKKSQDIATQMQKALMGGDAIDKKQYADKPKAGGTKTIGDQVDHTKDPSKVAQWETVNKEAKASYEFEHDLKTRDLADDVAYWESKVGIASTANGDDLKVAEKLAAAKLALKKKEASDYKAGTVERISADEQAGIAGLALAKAQSEQDLALGKITTGQLIAIETDLENRKFAIQVNAQNARIALAALDLNNPTALKAEKDKLLVIETQYQTALTGLKTKAAVEDNKYAKQFEDGMTSSFSGIIKTFATGTMSIKNLFMNMGKAVLSGMVDIFAQIAAKFLANQVMQQIGAKVTALSQVAANASVAGAAAFASIAAIPIVGPAMAPEAGLAAYAGAMSFAAAPGFEVGSWNVPGDMFTKVHAGETILNPGDASKFRSAVEGGASMGGGNGGGGNMNVNIAGQQLAGGFFLAHQSELVKALKQAARNGHTY